MPKFFVVAGAVALSGMVAGALTVPRGPAPATPAPVVKSVFDDRFELSADATLLKKQDRLAMPAPTPEPQAQIRIVPDPVVETMAVPTQRIDKKEEPPPQRRSVPHRYAASDICEKHGMHRVWFTRHHWRGWKCRR